MEHKKPVFVDFVKHLQEILDNVAQDTFEVSSIRNKNVNTKKISVVVSALAGSVFKNSAKIPYEVEVIYDKPDDIINIFTAIAKKYNNNSFVEPVEDEEGEMHEYTIYEFYSTPSVVERNTNFGIGQDTRLVMYVDLNILFEVGNVSKIEIDGEEIEFANGSLSYGIEQFSLRETGSSLNKCVKKSATTTLHLTMVNRICPFTNKLFDIMFGLLDGSNVFECKITLTNGKVGTLPMVLNSNAFNFAKNSPNLPSLDVVLALTKEN